MTAPSDFIALSRMFAKSLPTVPLSYAATARSARTFVLSISKKLV
jgi:hypothetical protein